MAVIVNGSGSGAIDSATTQGLAGVNNSLAYRVHEIERHLHSYERWMELAGTPAAETHRADAAGTGAGVFQIDAGNDTWGAWLQILGSSDTPVDGTAAKFDLHRILVTATERNAIYVLQIGFGATGAASLTADSYIEAAFIPASNAVDSGPVEIQSRRVAAGTKGWARCICPGQDTATLDFMIGLHEYEG